MKGVATRQNIQKQVLKYVPMALVGNLRLWSVQELVSSVLFVTAKTYTVKQYVMFVRTYNISIWVYLSIF